MLHLPGESKGQRREGKGGTDMGGKSSMEIKPLSTVNGADPQCLYMAMSPLTLMGTRGSERQRGRLVAWGGERPLKIKKHKAQRCYVH